MSSDGGSWLQIFEMVKLEGENIQYSEGSQSQDKSANKSVKIPSMFCYFLGISLKTY